MVYTRRQIKDIPYKIPCPFCGVYSTKQTRYLYSHIKNCEEYEGHIDDVNYEQLDEFTTVEDLIGIHNSKILLTKEFIQTNELEQIQNQTSEQIREYIKNKLCKRVIYSKDLMYECFDIYEFFFGLTDDDKNLKYEYLKNRVLQLLDWN